MQMNGTQFHEMTQEEFAQQPGTWFHGSLNGMVGPTGVVHVGDRSAAEATLRRALVRQQIVARGGDRFVVGQNRSDIVHRSIEENTGRAKRSMVPIRPSGSSGSMEGADPSVRDVKVYPTDPKLVAGTIEGPMDETASAYPSKYQFEGNKYVTDAWVFSSTPVTGMYSDTGANRIARYKRFIPKGLGVYYHNEVESPGSISAVMPRSHFKTHEDHLVAAREAGKTIPKRALNGYTEIPGQGKLF